MWRKGRGSSRVGEDLLFAPVYDPSVLPQVPRLPFLESAWVLSPCSSVSIFCMHCPLLVGCDVVIDPFIMRGQSTLPTACQARQACSVALCVGNERRGQQTTPSMRIVLLLGTRLTIRPCHCCRLVHTGPEDRHGSASNGQSTFHTVTIHVHNIRSNRRMHFRSFARRSRRRVPSPPPPRHRLISTPTHSIFRTPSIRPTHVKVQIQVRIQVYVVPAWAAIRELKLLAEVAENGRGEHEARGLGRDERWV